MGVFCFFFNNTVTKIEKLEYILGGGDIQEKKGDQLGHLGGPQ